LAEHIAGHLLLKRGLSATVRSAGVLRGGEPTPPVGVTAAADYGLDLSGHVSRQLTADLLDEADLVLTMSRAQAREIVVDRRDLWPRVFTLRSFVAEAAAQAGVPRRAAFPDWVATLGQDRKRSVLLGNYTADEVRDPMNQPAAVWREVIETLFVEIDALVTSCASFLKPPPRGSGR
jgi:protein-tyrosine phosphatase